MTYDLDASWSFADFPGDAGLTLLDIASHVAGMSVIGDRVCAVADPADCAQ